MTSLASAALLLVLQHLGLLLLRRALLLLLAHAVGRCGRCLHRGHRPLELLRRLVQRRRGAGRLRR